MRIVQTHDFGLCNAMNVKFPIRVIFTQCVLHYYCIYDINGYVLCFLFLREMSTKLYKRNLCVIGHFISLRVLVHVQVHIFAYRDLYIYKKLLFNESIWKLLNVYMHISVLISMRWQNKIIWINLNDEIFFSCRFTYFFPFTHFISIQSTVNLNDQHYCKPTFSIYQSRNSNAYC